MTLTPKPPEPGDFSPLQMRFKMAVTDTARRQVAAIACAPGDADCELCRWKAESELVWAGAAPSPMAEVMANASALATALTCE